ncbi:replication-associated recombination protein A [Sulfobacillus thermosulfidooxidans]|uniref:replication-associated recombination protein A n=1 Tax=Sulfobacillus thermosulfidooxidans TaxID=28034 RepID=UPI00040926BB|nr:replication-associated recombination protein A [Sulfobacillus thermosulfidooxidans]
MVSGDLFASAGANSREQHAPLAWKLRPRTLEEVAGQEHLTGPHGIIRSMLKGQVRSIIFHGPAGTGKTTLARIVAEQVGLSFVELSAIDSGVKEIRTVADQARERWNLNGKGTLLFLDEIHRFNRAQQDVLLPFVEDGTLVLFGATTENPWISINRALLSRCLLLEVKPLTSRAVIAILERAWTRRGEWWHPDGQRDPEVFEAIAERVGGDGRFALSVLEQMAILADAKASRVLSMAHLDEVMTSSRHYHDRMGDLHYDLTSAFIKSLRGSDPDAALYWFGRLLAGGTDPRYIMRRMMVHAAEDVGLADPMALVVATAAWTALEAVGLPEARIPMAQAVLYIAAAPKSNSVVKALGKLDEVLKRYPQSEVPSYLRDHHFGERTLHEGYRYPHDFPNHYVDQRYLPWDMDNIQIFEGSDQGQEKMLIKDLETRRRQGLEPNV